MDYDHVIENIGKVIDAAGVAVRSSATSSALSPLSPPLTGVAILAIIVLIRTFLSFSLEVELTGYWPWQRKTAQLPPE
jgi:Protein of unknown function (DUF1622)